MKKRLFIAINLPAAIKERISVEVSQVEKVLPLDVRFLSPENWHLTISFLGYQTDEALGEIIAAVREAAGNFPPSEIKFEKIIYGPPGKSPRMIWLLGDQATSRRLGELQAILETNLSQRRVPFRPENRRFTAHLTLARFETVPKSDLPAIEKNFPLSSTAETLDIMESKLHRAGAEYFILSKFPFQDKIN